MLVGFGKEAHDQHVLAFGGERYDLAFAIVDVVYCCELFYLHGVSDGCDWMFELAWHVAPINRAIITIMIQPMMLSSCCLLI